MVPYLVIILVASMFVAAAALYKPSPNSQPPKPTKPAASTYFETFNVTTDNFDIKSYHDSNGTYIKLFSIMFSIKPIAGPAHEVTATGFSDADPGDSLPFNLTQGKSGFIGPMRTTSSYPVESEIEPGKGFPVTLYISSLEAEGEITVYLNPYQ